MNINALNKFKDRHSAVRREQIPIHANSGIQALVSPSFFTEIQDLLDSWFKNGDGQFVPPTASRPDASFVLGFSIRVVPGQQFDIRVVGVPD